MSSDVKLFEKEEFGKVRVVMQGADPWFVASDVAKALGYANPQEATREHCRKVNKITQPSESLPSVKCPPTFINIIPESDVYRLVMRSNLPRAVEFQDWICEEVIPSIRKHGLYATEEVVDRILDDPDFGITLLQRYKFEREQRQLAEAQRDDAIRTKAEAVITSAPVGSSASVAITPAVLHEHPHSSPPRRLPWWWGGGTRYERKAVQPPPEAWHWLQPWTSERRFRP